MDLTWRRTDEYEEAHRFIEMLFEVLLSDDGRPWPAIPTACAVAWQMQSRTREWWLGGIRDYLAAVVRALDEADGDARGLATASLVEAASA